jgi:hypothetical protein
VLSPEQPGATPDFTPDLQNSKITHTKMRYLLHLNSIFRKLGLFEKLRKSTKTLCRETPRIFKRENTKCGEVRNLPK